MTAAANAVREIPDPYLRGQMHAFAALGAHLQSNLDRGVTHLVQASRALAAVPDERLGDRLGLARPRDGLFATSASTATR